MPAWHAYRLEPYWHGNLVVAKAFGAIVIATAGSPRKLEVAKSFGADHVIDYRDKTWPQQVKKLTPKGRGVDIVYDPVGLVDISTKCIAWNGRILVIGFAAGTIEKVAVNKVLLKNISLVGIHWGQYAVHEREAIPVVWNGIMKLIAEGKLRGTIFTDEKFVGLERVGDALVALGSRGTWGKVIIEVPQDKESKLWARRGCNLAMLRLILEIAALHTREKKPSPGD
jgi:NADPH:quinone reductase